MVGEQNVHRFAEECLYLLCVRETKPTRIPWERLPGWAFVGPLAPGFDLEVRMADLWEPERRHLDSEALDYCYYFLMALKLL